MANAMSKCCCSRCFRCWYQMVSFSGGPYRSGVEKQARCSMVVLKRTAACYAPDRSMHYVTARSLDLRDLNHIPSRTEVMVSSGELWDAADCMELLSKLGCGQRLRAQAYLLDLMA
ncbi:hypothetical protein CASFOL_036607 [Castilleja foliolosa]|uniref:Uncharacterized protein n=1 Tax=Castilleja foliolosa TaxID=1961234 RepID=A0ABD3BQY8_9LAMI